MKPARLAASAAPLFLFLLGNALADALHRQPAAGAARSAAARRSVARGLARYPHAGWAAAEALDLHRAGCAHGALRGDPGRNQLELEPGDGLTGRKSAAARLRQLGVVQRDDAGDRRLSAGGAGQAQSEQGRAR